MLLSDIFINKVKYQNNCKLSFQGDKMKRRTIIILMIIFIYTMLMSIDHEKKFIKVNPDINDTCDFYAKYPEFFKMYKNYLTYSFDMMNGNNLFFKDFSEDELKRAYLDYIKMIHKDLSNYTSIYFKNKKMIHSNTSISEKSKYFIEFCGKYSNGVKVFDFEVFRSIISQIINKKYNIPANQISIYRFIGTPVEIDDINAYHSDLDVRYITFEIERFIGLNKALTTHETIKIIGYKDFLKDISYGKKYLVNYYYALGDNYFGMISDHYNLFEIVNDQIEYYDPELNFDEIINKPNYQSQNGISLYFFKEKNKLTIEEFETSIIKILKNFGVLQ